MSIKYPTLNMTSVSQKGGAVTGSTYLLLKEGLDAFNTTPVEMDLNMCHLNISAAGKNRGRL